MTTHQRWAAKMMRDQEPSIVELEARAAERERRRIRRAQRDALTAIHNVRKYHPPGCPCQWCLLWNWLDAATRAPKTRRK